ncbi:O-antigen ligase family protein [Propionibacteriaceae bacterium Y1923]|uniref:O-antigen ligase family protein n=1 Tax=Aestuariimicrobium sp. Y1814 TaxID=3418742 RepID=UPI003C19DF25
MLAVLIPLTIFVMFAFRQQWVKLVMVLLLVVWCQQLVMTDGRAAMLVVVMTVALLLMRSWLGRATLAGALAAFWVAVREGFGPAVALWAQVYAVWDQVDEAPRSSWLRVQLMKSGWHMLRESNWIGVGPGGYGVRNLDPDNPVNIWFMPNAHWGMLEVMTEYGLVTLVVFLLVLAGGAAACLVLGRRRRRRDAAFGVGDFASRWSSARVWLSMTSIMLMSVPVISLSNSTWLRQPLTAVHLATLVAMVAGTLARTALVPRSAPATHG